MDRETGVDVGGAAVADALAEALERIAVGAVGLTTRTLAEHAPGNDLTFPQWRALLVLGDASGSARVSEVAARVGVTLPATGRQLRRLERRGLVALATDPDDGRATVASLTDEGRRVRSAILAARRSVLRELAAALPPGSHRDLAAGLRAIADALGRFA